MSSSSRFLLARLTAVLSVTATIGACGGETVSPTGETGAAGAAGGGSSAGAGGAAGTGGSAAGASGGGGSVAGSGGTGGTSAGAGGGGGSVAGSGGTGGTGAGAGGTAGTGGTSAGAGGGGGSVAGSGGVGNAAGTAGAAGSSECVPSGCEDVCYERVANEACLDGFADPNALTERLGCTGQTWGSSSPTDTQCCYLMGFCGVGRPLMHDNIPVVAHLHRGVGWS